MGRPKEDEFWNHVESGDESSKCKYCGIVFKGNPSISRIKYHLSGESGGGVRRCERVPDNVKSKAYEAIQESNKRRKTTPSSSSNPLSRQRNDQMEIEPTPLEVQAPGHKVLPGTATSFPHAEFKTFTANNGGETRQHQVGNASISNEAVESGQDGGEETFLTTELVGEKSQINKNKIWECLMNDGISSIGIYGMGGSGKTTLMKHIHNQLKETHLMVYWISVSQDFGIYTLQTLIAESIKLDLSNERDINKRAAKLWKALKGKQKCILILDDLWDNFDLRDVGIPREANGCKLVLTTRSLDVCKYMPCEEIIKVVPLSDDEAWRLFKAKLEAPLPSGVTDTAVQIVKECDGLPLGIITLVGSMRGVDDICEWRNALNELKQSQVSNNDMIEKLFSVLKFSYNRLTDLLEVKVRRL